MTDTNQRLLDICKQLPFEIVDIFFNYHHEHAYYYLGDQNSFDKLKETVNSSFSTWEVHNHVSTDQYLDGDFSDYEPLKSIRLREYAGEDESLVDMIFLLKSIHHEENVLVARLSKESFDQKKLIDALSKYFQVSPNFTVIKESYEHKLAYPERNGLNISNKQMSLSLDTITSITTNDQKELLSVLTSKNIVEIEFGDPSLEAEVGKIENILGVGNTENNLFAPKYEKKSELILKAIKA